MSLHDQLAITLFGAIMLSPFFLVYVVTKARLGGEARTARWYDPYANYKPRDHWADYFAERGTRDEHAHYALYDRAFPHLTAAQRGLPPLCFRPDVLREIIERAQYDELRARTLRVVSAEVDRSWVPPTEPARPSQPTPAPRANGKAQAKRLADPGPAITWPFWR